MLVYTQVLTAFGIFFTAGWNSPYLPRLAMVCVGLPSYFSRRGVVVGGGFTFVALLVASLGPSLSGDLRLARVCSVACVIGVVTAVGYVMMRTELRYRGEAMLDPLTGLMNRRALPERFDDVRRQTLEMEAPIALLAVDIDQSTCPTRWSMHAPPGFASRSRSAWSVDPPTD